MAEEEKKEGEGTESEVESKGGSSKLLIIIILAVVLIGGAGAGAYFFISSGKESSAEAGHESAESAHAEAKPAAHGEAKASGHGAEGAVDAIQAHFYEVPEILVNLSSTGSANRYLKLKLNLEMSSEADMTSVERLMPRIVNDFQLYLRQLRVEDLQGASGVYRLREALLLRANQAAQPLQINDVLFKEILVQ